MAAGQRRLLLGALLGMAPFLILVVSFWDTGYDAGQGDYAQYLLHARALLEGRPYTDTGYLYSLRNARVGPRAYAPGLPGALALVEWTCGDDAELVYRLFLLAASLGGLVAIYLYVLRVECSGLAPAVVAFCGAASGWAWAATHVSTDLVFTALVWIILYRVDGRRGRPWTEPLLLSLLGAAAILVRPSGVALVPALVIVALASARRRGRYLITATVWFATFVTMNALLPVGSSYADQVSLRPLDLVRNVLAAGWHYRGAVSQSYLYPFAGHLMNDAYHAVAVVLMVLGFGVWLRGSRVRLATVFAACFLALHLLFWASTARYLWPLFPLFVYWMLRGTQWVLARRRLGLRPDRPLTLTLGIAAVLVLLATAQALHAERPAAFPSRPEELELVRWSRDLGKDARLAAFNPRVLTLQTGVPAMALFDGPPDQIVEQFCAQGITHVVLGDAGTRKSGQEALRETLRARSSAFRRIRGNASFELFAFRREVCPARDPG